MQSHRKGTSFLLCNYRCMTALCFRRNIFDGEADSSHLILAKAYHLHLIAKGQYILHMVDALLCDLGDVNHAFFTRSKLQECAELLDADYRSGEDLSLPRNRS